MIPEYAMQGLSIITFLLSSYAVINLKSLKEDEEDKIRREKVDKDHLKYCLLEVESILGRYEVEEHFLYHKEKSVVALLHSLMDELGYELKRTEVNGVKEELKLVKKK